MTHPECQLDTWTAQWAVQALARWSFTVAAILGLLIVIGGDARFSSASYAAALSYPYAPESWGVALLTAGVLGLAASLLGRLKVTAVALGAVAVWCVFFGWSFLSAAQANPNAGTTGVPIYGFAAVVASVLAVTHWKSATARR